MPKKNVLFILTDQFRADCLGFAGNPYIKTPNLDKLASQSAVFSNCHTVTPLCSPARGCLMTGKLPFQNGVIDNLNVGASIQKPLSDDNPTWLCEAEKNQYRTAYFGKWHLGQWNADKKNIDMDTCNNELNPKPKKYKNLANERGELIPGAYDIQIKNWERTAKHVSGKMPFYALRADVKSSAEYKIGERAKEFLDTADNTPWCLTVSFPGPHFPHLIPEPYYSMYDPDMLPLPSSLNDRFVNKPWFQNRHWWPSMNTDGLTDKDWQKTIAAYYGFVTYVDEKCGEIIEYAKKHSGGRPTQFVFTADHGEMLGSHSRFDKGAYYYEEVMRTPLIICNDICDSNSKRSKFDNYCNTQDIAKTLFSMVNPDNEANGRSLLDVIGENSTDIWEKESFGVYQKYNGHSFEVRCIATEKYKYSFVPQDLDELYDLEKDPNEIINVSDSDEYREIKAKLKERLFTFMKNNNDPILDKLDSLGQAGILDKD